MFGSPRFKRIRHPTEKDHHKGNLGGSSVPSKEKKSGKGGGSGPSKVKKGGKGGGSVPINTKKGINGAGSGPSKTKKGRNGDGSDNIKMLLRRFYMKKKGGKSWNGKEMEGFSDVTITNIELAPTKVGLSAHAPSVVPSTQDQAPNEVQEPNEVQAPNEDQVPTQRFIVNSVSSKVQVLRPRSQRIASQRKLNYVNDGTRNTKTS
ncbi:hypothetical protein Tco_0232001 [Tanacetum coccineum]